MLGLAACQFPAYPCSQQFTQFSLSHPSPLISLSLTSTVQVSQKVALMEQLQGTLQGVEEKVAQEEEVSRGLTRRLEEAQVERDEGHRQVCFQWEGGGCHTGSCETM
jgi:hypothetical protein